jgi:hypothetical protein
MGDWLRVRLELDLMIDVGRLFKTCEVMQTMLLSGAAIQDSIVLVRKGKREIKSGGRG